MARHRPWARAPLPWAAIPGIYEHLLEKLAQLPRDAAGVLLRSAAACLRQVAAALLRLLRGPALRTCKNARPQHGNPPVRPGPQGGDAIKGACLGGPAQAGEPISKKDRRRPGKPPVRPGTQGGDAVKGACLGGPEHTGAPISNKSLRGPGKPPVRPGTQGDDAVKGACFAAPDSASGAEVPELAESDTPFAKNSCSEFGEVPTTTTPLDDSISGWKLVTSKRSKIAPQFPPKARDYSRIHDQRHPPQIKCCTYCKENGHLAMDCPGNGIKASSRQISGCNPTREGCNRNDKHVNEEKYNLDMLFADEEEDAETKAHRSYHVKVCKKGHILCLACHLSGKEVLVEDNADMMKVHWDNKHGPHHHWCQKSGCLAVAKTKHDIGVHQYICHGI